MDFVRLWNSHDIRPQPNRKHVKSGKPYALYILPDPESAVDCRIPVNQTVLDEMRAALKEHDPIDIDAYLPSDVMAICDSYMAEVGGLPSTLPLRDVEQPWITEYVHLRDCLREHVLMKMEPKLSLLASYQGDNNYYDDIFGSRPQAEQARARAHSDDEI